MYYRPDEPVGMDRDFFNILEGAHRDKIACVKTSSGLSSHATSSRWFQAAHPTGAASLVFTLDRSTVDADKIHGILKFNGQSAKAFTDSGNILSVGEYPVRIPDAPHSGGQYYKGLCKSPMTWFRIGDGDRYLHPGRGSLGCITVEVADWDKVFNYVINARAGDKENVGKVKVEFDS
jgi:hypothetical protein